MHEAVLRKLGQAAGLVEPSSHFAMKCSLSEEEKKFAELIVAETIQVGLSAFMADASVVPTFPAQKIRDHFGLT